MKNKQVKFGVVLSYTLIVLNALYGLIFIPFIISNLGDAEYGVYKTISSFSSSLMVLDLGIGGTVLRYVAKYRSNKEDHKISNFVAMNLIQAAILSFIIIVACCGCYFAIKPIYGSTFSFDQIGLAQKLFVILSINIIGHVFENVLNGVITGYNNFIFANGLKLIRLVIRILCLVILLPIFKNALLLVITDLVLTLVLVFIEFFYIKYKLNLKIRFSKWDNSLFKESAKYTFLMFLTSLIAQVNNNLDNVIIGALSGPAFVTVYSIGLTFFGIFENLSTSISGVMLPTVTNALASENPDEQVKAVVIKAGRFQFALLGAAVIGFVILGKEFITLWMGNGYEDAYIVGLVLMLPALLVLCVNVCLSILSAKNLLEFRTFVSFTTTIVNALITYFTVRYWSYLGAAIGTAFSVTVGSFIFLNLYYIKKLNLPMIRIYGAIFSGTWICLLISGIVIGITSRYIRGTWLAFIINVLIFLFVYLSTMLLFGLKKEEKKSLPIIKKFIRRNKND